MSQSQPQVQRTSNFQTSGLEWNGANQWIVPIGGALSGTASVSPAATSISVDVETGMSPQTTGVGLGAVNRVVLAVGSTQVVLYDIYNGCVENECGGCWGGCSNPFCPSNPPALHYQLPDDLVQAAVAAGSVKLTISICGEGSPVILAPVGTLTQEIPASSAQGTATITVLDPDGNPVAGATVSLVDDSTGTSYGVQTTNSNGQAVFSGLPVGDSFTASSSHAGASGKASFTLSGTSANVALNLACASGYVWQNGQCTPKQPAPTSLEYSVLTSLKYIGIIVGVGAAAFIAAKLIPERRVVEEKGAQPQS